MAEMYNSCSPYAYVLNNPVNLFDPNGMYSMFFNGEEVDGDAKRNLQSRMGLTDDRNSDETSSNVETGIPTSFGDLLGQFGKFIGLGLKNEIGSSDFDQKKAIAEENREMTVLAIETANGVMSILVPVSSLADVMYKVEAGHGLAALADVPFVVLDIAGGPADEIYDGMRLASNDALSSAIKFLGKDYIDAGNWRFISKDGKRVVRMGDSDLRGHGGGSPHMNFEVLGPNPDKQGKMKVINNMHIFLTD
jgi:hypothetical protein